MNYTILGQVLDVKSLAIGAGIGLLVFLILAIISYAIRKRKKKGNKNIKVLKQEIEEIGLLLDASNERLGQLHSFFDNLELRKRQRNEREY